MHGSYKNMVEGTPHMWAINVHANYENMVVNHKIHLKISHVSHNMSAVKSFTNTFILWGEKTHWMLHINRAQKQHANLDSFTLNAAR